MSSLPWPQFWNIFLWLCSHLQSSKLLPNNFKWVETTKYWENVDQCGNMTIIWISRGQINDLYDWDTIRERLSNIRVLVYSIIKGYDPNTRDSSQVEIRIKDEILFHFHLHSLQYYIMYKYIVFFFSPG